MSPFDSDLFEIHASPEAILARMEEERDRIHKAHRELGRLEVLYLHRCAERAAGLWPTASAALDKETRT